MDVTPERVIEVLHEVGVRSVLMGTHALNTYRSEARATQDVDVLVRRKDIRRAVRALHDAFPELTIQDAPVVTRFLDPGNGKPVVDVMKPTQTVFQVVFRHTIPIGETHDIPDLEMCLASKFAAMVSPNRAVPKKLIDAGDFADVVLYNRASIDLKKLKRLGDIVYPNGGTEILRIVADLDAGRSIEL